MQPCCSTTFRFSAISTPPTCKSLCGFSYISAARPGFPSPILAYSSASMGLEADRGDHGNHCNDDPKYDGKDNQGTKNDQESEHEGRHPVMSTVGIHPRGQEGISIPQEKRPFETDSFIVEFLY